jgi:hypothetical protein
MAGMMKRKFNSETGKYMKGFTSQLSKVATTLPLEYDKNLLLERYKEFYPNQWTILINRYDYYLGKDLQLVSVGKKKRYNHKNPINFFNSLAKVKQICSDGYKRKHKASYCEVARQQAIEVLNKKIKKPKEISSKLQFTDPYHLDVFISAYHKRGSTQHNKLEIVNELKKFKTKETIKFFQKLNDSERNSQIRDIAFEHLQSIDAYVRKRKGFKGKKKSYHIDTDKFIVTPADLVDKLKHGGIQSKKTFDLFISHSYKDNKLVSKLVSELNKHGLHIYCDWTSDDDFLKRELVSEFTEVVLKERISQSNKVLFLQTENSVDIDGEVLSPWVKMELEYATGTKKEIQCINTTPLSPLFTEVTAMPSEFKIETSEINKLRT